MSQGLCSTGCSGTCNIDQAVFKLREIRLPLLPITGIKDVHCADAIFNYNFQIPMPEVTEHTRNTSTQEKERQRKARGRHVQRYQDFSLSQKNKTKLN